MYPRLILATLTILYWASSAQAQNYEHGWHEHEHEHQREHEWDHRSVAPSYAHHVPEPAKPVHDADWQTCDKAGAEPVPAIAACDRVIARKHLAAGLSLAVAYTNRALAFQAEADFAHAIADYSEAIRLKPDVSGYFAMRGTAREKSGDPQDALSDFRLAANLDANNQDAADGVKRLESRSVVSTGEAAAQASMSQASVPPTQAAPPSTAQASAVQTATATAAARTSATQTPIAAAGPPASVQVASAKPAVVPTPPSIAAPTDVPGARVALVIGNGAYVNANVLPNPPNDARAIAVVLRQIGFEVVEGENLDRSTMENDFRDFLHRAANASVVLLFYAGHGMQVDGKNYLVPVDAKLAAASDLAFETIDVDKILDALAEPGRTNIILLDACRDNPLARSFASRLPPTRSAAVASGLAAYSALGTGTLIAYATAPGQTALDGAGRNSPFTSSLLHYLPVPGMEIRQTLTRVRAEVASQTNNRQIPWDNSSLMGDVYLVQHGETLPPN